TLTIATTRKVLSEPSSLNTTTTVLIVRHFTAPRELMEFIRRRILPKHSRTSVSRRSCWTRAQRASYLFRPFTAQTSGCAALRFYTMDQDGLRPSRTGETPMVQAPYAVKRANPRFSFLADAEVTLRDGTRAVAQLAELSPPR